MRKEFVYSVLALGGAIPVTVNAAEVSATSVDLSVTAEDGAEVIKKEIGTLQPGTYKLTGKLTSRLYKVTIKIGGKEETYEPDNDNDTDVDIDFTLTEATNVTMEADSESDASGSKFTLGSMVLNLNFDFAAAKSTLNDNATALKTTINGYNYDGKADDVKSAEAIITKIGKIAESYDSYKTNQLYDLDNCPIQQEIDELAESAAAKEVDYQEKQAIKANNDAYNAVNDQVEAMQTAYNTAVESVKAELTGAAAYLQTAADEAFKAIQDKIDAANKANYNSQKAGTAVDDKDTNLALLPTQAEIEAIVTDYKGQADNNKAKYAALEAQVTALNTALQEIVDGDAYKTQSANFATEKQAADDAIAAVNTKVTETFNTKNQLTLNVDTEVATANAAISDLKTKVEKAYAQANAQTDINTAIAAVQQKLNEAKEAVNAKKYGEESVETYYADLVAGIQAQITALAPGEDVTDFVAYKAAMNTTDIEAAIEEYQTQAVAAVEFYDELQTAIKGYQDDLDAAIEVFGDSPVLAEDGGDYQFKLDKIQKKINDIQAAIDAAKDMVGKEHWDAMLKIDKQEGITEEIAQLVSEKKAAENAYEAKGLDSKITSLQERIDALVTTEDKLGTEAPGYTSEKTDIQDELEALTGAIGDIDANSETVDYTDKATAGTWNVTGTANNHGITVREKYGDASVGTKITLDVDTEDGLYDVEVYATSHNARGEGGASLNGTAEDVAYVFATSGSNTVKKYITARGIEPGFVDGEDIPYTLQGVTVENGKLTIGLALDKADQTGWHTLQIKSLKASTASLLAGWSENVDKIGDELTVVEKAAEVIANGIASNTSTKNALTSAVTTLEGQISTFTDEYLNNPATLGNSYEEINTEEQAISTALDAAKTAINGVTPTNVAVDVVTEKVKTGVSDWPTVDIPHNGAAGRTLSVDGVTLVEQWTSSGNNAGTGVVMAQKLTELPNGVYDIEIYANAADQNEGNPNAGATDIAYVYGNDVLVPITVTSEANLLNAYTIKNVVVSDGTLEMGLKKVKGGTNWHSIQIKSLTAHTTNAAAAALAEQDEAINKAETGLKARQAALEEKAPGIKDAVANNEAAKTTADAAIATQTTYLTDKTKSLSDVTKDGQYDGYSNPVARKAVNGKFWWVYQTGLDEDKTFKAEKAAVEAKIAEIEEAVATAYANETLDAEWTSTLKAQTEALQTMVDAIVTKADAESKNYWAYRNAVKNNDEGNNGLSKALTNAADGLEDVAGSGAYQYYSDLLADYKAQRDQLVTVDMVASLNARTATSTMGDSKKGFIKQIIDLKNLVNAVQTEAAANLAKYEEQQEAYTETVQLWNEAKAQIDADDTSRKEDLQKQLDDIFADLSAKGDGLYGNYKEGKAVESAVDFSAIKNQINAVTAQQSDGYDTAVQADNETAHTNFQNAIAAAKKAFQDATATRQSYSSSNKDIEAAVSAAATEFDDILYNCPEEITTLESNEGEEFAGIKSPAHYDATANITAAQNIQKKIQDAESAFKTAIVGIITNNVWTPKKTVYEDAVTKAEAAIASYGEDAQKDAFQDVKALIKQGDDGAAAGTLSEVEAAINALDDAEEGIEPMLAADINNAAKADIDAAVNAAETKYTETTDALDEYDADAAKTADLKAALETSKTDNLDAAKEQEATDYEAGTLADRYDAIQALIAQFSTDCDNAITAANNNVKANAANLEAYQAMVDTINVAKGYLAQAQALQAQYKYVSQSFTTVESNLTTYATRAETYKANGTASRNLATQKKNVGTQIANIKTYLTREFNNNKTQLAANDIEELKAQYNLFAADFDQADAAAEYKAQIEDLAETLEAQVMEISADNLFSEYTEATEALQVVQANIAALLTKLTAKNDAATNGRILANLTETISTLQAKANLEGKDEWVGQQYYSAKPVGGASYKYWDLETWIEELNQNLTDVTAEIEADKDQLTFYKEKYESKLDAIETLLDNVLAQAETLQQQVEADTEDFNAKTEVLNGLKQSITDAKAKVEAYTYVGGDDQTDYSALLDDETGAQYYIDEDELWLGMYHANKVSEYYDLRYTAKVEQLIQQYLDDSANAELDGQKTALTDALNAANEALTTAGESSYTATTWAALLAEKTDIEAAIAEISTEAGDEGYEAEMEKVSDIQERIDNFEATVEQGKLGDVSGDGIINTLDYTQIIDIMIGNVEQPEAGTDAFEAADINGDGQINIIDATQLVNIILYGNPQGNVAAARGAAQPQLTVNDKVATTQLSTAGENVSLNATAMDNGNVRLAVMLDNVNTYSNMQMDITLPEGMTLVGQSLASRTGDSHALYAANGRILVMSADNAAITGNSGAVLYLDVKVDNSYNGGDIELSNVILTDAQGNYGLFQAINAEATGIDMMNADDSLMQKVYNMGGRVVDYLKKGVSIIRRADGSTEKVIRK